MVVNKENVGKFVNLFAHEIAKCKTGNAKIDKTDGEVTEVKKKICHDIEHGSPHVHTVVSIK